jgi:pimeloyl-ACP methyl ester carboxylesterase
MLAGVERHPRRRIATSGAVSGRTVASVGTYQYHARVGTRRYQPSAPGQGANHGISTIDRSATVSDEDRFCAVGRDLQLCYRTCGSADDPPLLLIAGLGQQLIAWPDELCRGLSEAGFYVVRFDNRDVGRSSRHHAPAPTALQFLTRRWSAAQYTVEDMALDTVGLIDALGLAPAHLVGMSMGGMVAQTVAARHPDRVATLTSIMSTTGARRIGRPAPSTWLRMMRPRPRDENAALDAFVAMMRHIGSHGFAFDESRVRALGRQAWERGDGPRAAEGSARQLAAIFKSGDRTGSLASITAPTLVIHGDRDRMVHPSGANATADAIAGARQQSIMGMGHDLPEPVWPRIVDLITRHAARRGTRSAAPASRT